MPVERRIGQWWPAVEIDFGTGIDELLHVRQPYTPWPPPWRMRPCFTLMAADTPSHMGHTAGGAVTISLSGDDADDLRRYWHRLAEGGLVTLPLEVQMWGDEFGMCTDRFGVAWMVNVSQPSA